MGEEQGHKDGPGSNRNNDPGKDAVQPMAPESWSGGSINPEAKEIARGEKPANSEAKPGPVKPSDPATPPEVTRPWSPRPTEGGSTGSTPGVDYAGRVENASTAAEEPRTPREGPRDNDAGGGRPEVAQ